MEESQTDSSAGFPPWPGRDPFDLEQQRRDLLTKMGLGEHARIGQYELIREIGRGAMGVVYLALDHDLDRQVAIKRVQNQGNQELRRHLVHEAKAMAQLSHPNVVPVYEIREHDDMTFIVMEYVEGVTLNQWLRQEPRAIEEILVVFMAAGSGLAAAHSRKLVHRDFKPTNVMLGSDNRVRVMDFGLACPDPGQDSTLVLESDAPRHDSDGNGIAGTPAYMAPEQFRGRWADARSDQFSFCVALYEALYGERPFLGTREQIWAAAERGEIRPESPHASVPKWLRQVVVRGLEPDPRCRFESMQALLDTLGAKPQSVPSTRWPRAATYATGLGLLVTFVVATWLVRPHISPTVDQSPAFERVIDEARAGGLARASLEIASKSEGSQIIEEAAFLADHLFPPPTIDVELRESTSLASGKFATYRGEADQGGVAFSIKGLSIGTPVGILLASGDPDSPMTLQVGSDPRVGYDKKFEPDGHGIAEARFRTVGSVTALVTSNGKLEPFELVVWVGPNVALHRLMKPPFVTQVDYDEGKKPGSLESSSRSSIGIVIAVVGALLVIILFLVVRFQKGRAS